MARPVSGSAWLRTLRWPTELRLTGLLSSCAPAATWPSTIDIMLFGRLKPSRWLANRSRLNRAPAPPAKQPTYTQNPPEVTAMQPRDARSSCCANVDTPPVAQLSKLRDNVIRCLQRDATCAILDCVLTPLIHAAPCLSTLCLC